MKHLGVCRQPVQLAGHRHDVCRAGEALEIIVAHADAACSLAPHKHCSLAAHSTRLVPERSVARAPRAISCPVLIKGICSAPHTPPPTAHLLLLPLCPATPAASSAPQQQQQHRSVATASVGTGRARVCTLACFSAKRSTDPTKRPPRPRPPKRPHCVCTRPACPLRHARRTTPAHPRERRPLPLAPRVPLRMHHPPTCQARCVSSHCRRPSAAPAPH